MNDWVAGREGRKKSRGWLVKKAIWLKHSLVTIADSTEIAGLVCHSRNKRSTFKMNTFTEA